MQSDAHFSRWVQPKERCDAEDTGARFLRDLFYRVHGHWAGSEHAFALAVAQAEIACRSIILPPQPDETLVPVVAVDTNSAGDVCGQGRILSVRRLLLC